MTPEEKRTEADNKAQQWLAKANDKREQGKSDEREMKQAQKWLDRLNKLEGSVE